jgi:predicted ATP-grasp superfamily ATP-dependent carboligase
MTKVIILNATELGYQVIRSLGEKGIRSIVLYDQEKDEIGRYSKYVIESYKIPGFIANSELLMDFLWERRLKWAGTLIIPTKDYTVEFLAKNKATLSNHYLIPTPDYSVIERVVNKNLLYAAAEKLGIAIPKTYSPKSLEQLNNLYQKIRFPCLIKPGLGHVFFRDFDFKMIEVHNFYELVDNYRRITSDFTRNQYDLSICEIIPGLDSELMVQYVSYIDRSGQLLASMTSRKIRQDPPQYGQGRVVKSEKTDGLEQISLSLLKELEYYGFSEIEWKYDRIEKCYKLIEINPRYIFYIGLCTECGINFPYIQCLDIVKNHKITNKEYADNIYWIHLYKDILHTTLHRHLENFSLKEYIEPYFGRKVFAVWNRRDLKPFLHQWKQHMLNMIITKLLKHNSA